MTGEMKNSGVEWLGAIPNDWSVRQVGQLAEQTKTPNADMVERNLLSLSYGQIKRRDIDSRDGLLPASFETYNIVEPNDIVLRFTDLQNDQKSLRVGLVCERGIITSAYTTIRPHNAEDARFLYYSLHAFDLCKGFYGMGAGVRQGLKWQEAKYILLPWPSAPSRKHIADYLDATCAEIDAAIQSAQASIDNLLTYRNAKLDEIMDNAAQGSHHVKLKYLLRESKDRSTDGVGEPLSITIARGVLKSSELNVPNPTSSLVGAKVVHAGDLVFNKLKARHGVMYVSPYDGLISPEYAIYQAIDESVVSLRYLEYLCHTTGMIDEFIIRTSGVAEGFRRLYTADLFDIAIQLPERTTQDVIVANLDALYQTIADSSRAKQAIIDDLNAYKQSLIYEVVTGKREV